MLALLASVLLIGFVVVPGIAFRFAFSVFVPLKAFDRTRTQELAYSVVVCALPFFLALVLVHKTPLGAWPFRFQDTWALGEADYQTVFLSCFGDAFAAPKDEFWAASVRATQRVARLLFWYLGLVTVEALALGLLVSKWGSLQPRLARWPRAEQFATRALLWNVSEWHVLLTSFLFPGTTVQVDVLTTEDRLYQGDVLGHTREQDGRLLGIYLSNVQRYDRAGLTRDREQGTPKPTSAYWKAVPGSRYFVFADKIATLNIRPQTTLAAADKLVRELDPGATVTMKVVEDQASQATSVSPPPPGATAQ